MNILVISSGYPSVNRPEYPFVEQLCNEWARQGHCITVIAPHSRTKRLVRKLLKVDFKRETFSSDNGGSVTVYSPEYWSFGNKGKCGPNQFMFERAVKKVAKHLPKPDFVYGHFWHNARRGYEIARKWNVPLVTASGEAEIEQTANTAKDKAFAEYVKAVVCVSTKNKNESIELRLTTADKCAVFPNSIDENLFYKKDKQEIRTKLGLPHDAFIVCFVGGFIPRKGPDRVANAIKSLNNPNIKSIFIGGGQDGCLIRPNCEGILFQGKISHDDIPDYLNAADVFVLPTLHEGCCNAIVEAMACGLPIISSNLPFNWDILNGQNSIMVNPMNIEQIAEAINKLYSDKKLINSMSDASLTTASGLTICKRATKILEFIKERTNLG